MHNSFGGMCKGFFLHRKLTTLAKALWDLGNILHYAHLTVPNSAHIEDLTFLSNRKITLKET